MSLLTKQPVGESGNVLVFIDFSAGFMVLMCSDIIFKNLYNST